jgi:hypothetical protein
MGLKMQTDGSTAAWLVQGHGSIPALQKIKTKKKVLIEM